MSIVPPSRDLSPEDWIGSGVSIGWLSMITPEHVHDQVEAAWQELFREPAWLDWLIAHDQVIHAVDMFLWVEDRDEVRARHGRDLDYYVPARMLTGGPDQVRQVAREIIHGIYAKRAEKAGIAAPPPV